jgi:hypothetical protein
MIKDGIAPTLARAHAMSTDKMAATLLKGYELGLSFTASLELVQVVQGKTSLSPRGALALMQTSPVIKSVDVKRLSDNKGFIGYECVIKRVNGFEFTARWTMEQAAKAGLIKAGGGWESYPENMCMWRAVGFAADAAASDVTCGLTAFLKMPEQMGLAIDDGGNVVDAASVTVVNPLAEEIGRLVNDYGAEAVMSVNNNSIPTTLEQCAEIDDILFKRVIKSANGGV